MKARSRCGQMTRKLIPRDIRTALTTGRVLGLWASTSDDAGVRSGNTTINGTIIGGNGNSGNNSSNGGSNIGSNGGNGGNNANSGNITGGNGNQGNSGNSGSVGGGVIIGGNVAGNGGNRGDKRISIWWHSINNKNGELTGANA
ncbi:hypothetical protein EYR38_006294 [Pleurotus pulmonarius]|nr:hypothetical protein EYR38_006294 [Pleurotus pulmonarius]